MKRIYILLIVFLLSLSVFAQQKKDNTITIVTNLPAAAAFTAWGKHLAANGYSIDRSDANFFTLSTGPKDTSKGNYAFLVNSYVNDQGQIQVRMKWQVKSSALDRRPASSFEDWEYSTSTTNERSLIFQDISKVISSFGQYPVSYSAK